MYQLNTLAYKLEFGTGVIFNYRSIAHNATLNFRSETPDRRQSPTTGKPAMIINRDEEVIFSQN